MMMLDTKHKTMQQSTNSQIFSSKQFLNLRFICELCIPLLTAAFDTELGFHIAIMIRRRRSHKCTAQLQLRLCPQNRLLQRLKNRFETKCLTGQLVCKKVIRNIYCISSIIVLLSPRSCLPQVAF